jgi:hypothetical protein
MRRSTWRPSPAAIISLIALVLAFGGTVYAAKRINGRTIITRSLPGNRLKPRSVPGNRLRPRSVPANRLSPGVLGRQIRGPITGADIDEGSLGTVPSAVHAQTADRAGSAVDAETALNAVNAVDAQTVNGHGAGCGVGTQAFAGACWESSPSPAVAAPAAAAECAARGGTLPEALQLAAFANLPGVSLDPDDEWTNEIAGVSGLDLYSVVTISAEGKINFVLSTVTRKYRCVIPIVT